VAGGGQQALSDVLSGAAPGGAFGGQQLVVGGFFESVTVLAFSLSRFG